jgi:hypothetical protein
MGVFEKVPKFLVLALVLPLLVINLILTSMLFYLLTPFISPTYNTDHAQRVVQYVMPLVGADAVAVWAVNLETNSRKALSYAVTDPKDHEMFTRYVELAQVMKFTAAVNPPIVQTLLSGDGMCYQLGKTGVVASTIVGDFIKDNPNAMSCVFPVSNNSTGILNSYVLMIWKTPLDADRQRQVLQQVKVAINQR